jgi:hypothetical protein
MEGLTEFKAMQYRPRYRRRRKRRRRSSSSSSSSSKFRLLECFPAFTALNSLIVEV